MQPAICPHGMHAPSTGASKHITQEAPGRSLSSSVLSAAASARRSRGDGGWLGVLDEFLGVKSLVWRQAVVNWIATLASFLDDPSAAADVTFPEN
nr:hypothetical protein Iba_chr12aCG4590 [Ipomoea batatas]GMD67771.1 hypothetical protein Iba_chr12dCG2740 [Ipomoea batatas]